MYFLPVTAKLFSIIRQKKKKKKHVSIMSLLINLMHLHWIK